MVLFIPWVECVQYNMVRLAIRLSLLGFQHLRGCFHQIGILQIFSYYSSFILLLTGMMILYLSEPSSFRFSDLLEGVQRNMNTNRNLDFIYEKLGIILHPESAGMSSKNLLTIHLQKWSQNIWDSGKSPLLISCFCSLGSS